MGSPIKDRILAAIQPDEVIALAKDLARIPSYTTEETAVAEFVDGFFRRNWLESELQEVDPGRFQTIARLPGTRGQPGLMLNGHLDIDPIPSGWVRDPWMPSIEGDRFDGAGIPCCLYGPAGGFDEGSADRWTSVEQIITCTRVFGAMIADVCA